MRAAQSTTPYEGMTVTISRFGHENMTITLPVDATVGQALSVAGIEVSGSAQMFVAGITATPDAVLEDGDVLSIVTPKQAA